MRKQRKAFYKRPEWLILGIICIAANLRAPVTGVAPVIESIQHSYALTAAQAGLLTSSPLLFFALFSLVAAPLARSVGLERALFIALSAMVVGVFWRVYPSVFSLYAGNNLIAVGIALGNVLVPSLIKAYFPQRIAFLTAIYSLMMGISAAVVSALAIPLTEHTSWGWRSALLSVGVMVVVSWLVWLPQIRKGARRPSRAAQQTQTPMWRHPIAWQVTFFLGGNSLFYYIFVSWLPSLLISLGFSAALAANMHGLMQLASAVAGLLILPIVRHYSDQRPAVICSIAPIFIGLLGLWWVPSWAFVWALLLGLGSGAVFVLALSFFGLRVTTTAQAASLAGMAQFIGYLMAATGPSLMGAFYDWTHSWVPMLVFCLVVSIIMLVFGLAAGRNVKIK